MGTASSRGRDEMASGAAEPTAKRQKVDEAEEEEDPLVRRREELALGFANARAKGKELGERMVREAKLKRKRLRRKAKKKGKRMVREAKERAILESDRTLTEATLSFGQELRSVCADLEAKNEKLLRRLPPELWQKILHENLHPNDLLALAMTCKFFREKTKHLWYMGRTNLNLYHLVYLPESVKVASHSLGWFQWVCDTFGIRSGFSENRWSMKSLEGAVYEGDLLNYAAFQGSVKILRWLMEEKGCEPNGGTGRWAGWSGSVEILEYLSGWGYEFDKRVCEEAARGGHLEALKFLRGLDPPCPWDEKTCEEAAKGGHLEVLKWARSEDPPCPWNVLTCCGAAEGGHLEVLKFVRGLDPPCPWCDLTCEWAAKGGHLEVLKWARSQDPPCPWNRGECSWAASFRGHHHIDDWIFDQQEDESDAE